MEFTFKEVEVQKLNLQPGDILFIKVYSDDFDAQVLEKFRKSLKPAFPNNEVTIVGLSQEDKIELTVVTKGE